MMRLVRLARETNATSLADLIATRLGKDAWLAATVTLVAALGLIPYIALQLKAVAMSFAHADHARATPQPAPPWQDSALYVALAMALFAMLFGTRRASAAEHNRGLVLAMAFESLFKLAAMLALGAFVWFGLESTCRAQASPAPPRRPAVSRRWCCSARWRCSSCRTSSTSAWSSAATSATCAPRAGSSRCTWC